MINVWAIRLEGELIAAFEKPNDRDRFLDSVAKGTAALLMDESQPPHFPKPPAFFDGLVVEKAVAIESRQGFPVTPRRGRPLKWRIV